MKAKIFYLVMALVLALSFSLVTAVPAGAQEAPSVTLDVPTNVYRPAPFDVSSTTTNPTGGTAYDNVRFDITVSGPEAFTGNRVDIFTITHVNGSTDTQGINDTFTLVGGDFVGYWGPVGGFPLPAPYAGASIFTIQMTDDSTAPVGNYEVTVELVDLLPEPDVTLATATDGFSLSADTLYVGAGQQFTTIQNAIDAASAGDTVIVADGTYSENIVVNKSLTIQAASSPIIDGGGTLWVPAVDIQAADVMFQGFVIQNFKADVDHDWAAVYVHGDNATIDHNTIANITTADPGGDPFGIGIDVWTESGANTDIQITNNVVHDVDSIGIRVRDDWRIGQQWSGSTGISRNVLVEGNTVYSAGNSNVLITGFAEGVTVRNNEIYNSSEPNRYGIRLCIYPSDVTIEGNYIHDNYRNVVIAGADDVTISGNTIEDTLSASINVYITNNYNTDVYEPAGFPGPWPEILGGITVDTLSTNISIANNDIQNAGYGVKIENFGAADPTLMVTTTTINWNNIYGNTEYGVENTINPAVVDATVNWWGDISGPEHDVEWGTYPANPGGTGDKVSDNVNYEPWLTRLFETVLDDNIAYFGIPMVWLDTGWNTFSTPIALDPAVDTWGEYVALGDGLAIHAISPAYSFDGATQTWVLLTATYPLKPCDAIYVRMAEPDIAAILLSPNVSVPAKQLYAGWNLVGLAWMPVGPPPPFGLPLDEALVSVAGVTGGLTGYVQVVSPPVYQYPWIYTGDPSQISTSPNWVDWTGLEGWMLMTDGYWVFMLNPGIVAGFTFTPMSLGMGY